MQSSDGGRDTEAPTLATDAVLVRSQPIPDGVPQIDGIEFNDYRDRDISVPELLKGMTNMGFQASAVADATRIVNKMVCDGVAMVQAID